MVNAVFGFGFGFAACFAMFMIGISGVAEDDRVASERARDYCDQLGTVAVGQYCLTEAELVLRRVPERF